ncbi:MAG: hypothetical protein LBK55_07595 [Azoarcus sp.]|jgi:hypothetical protein|nr:hypothetical protein [Azoarcus sp.]
MKKQVLCIAVACGMLTGCLAVGSSVREDKLTQRTAYALGLNPADFTISDKTKDGIRTDYIVTTTKGDRYWCHIEAGASFMGQMVGDAMCNEAPGNTGGAGSKGKTGKTGEKPITRQCNELLRAAGRC